MTVTLPTPLDKMVAAINAGDTEAFLALFTDKGAVNDWGRRFAGQSAIRKWSDKELIGARGTMTVTAAERTDNRITFTADWQSNFYSGVGEFVVALDGNRIRELRILET